ncbi:MAG: UbiD family decarboxylase [Deltaproteobacteria bacterium]|nr:UbiD family decarboxylase [Deltaproteobacteria bacterium]
MAFRDHRDFFELLEKEGELARITREVDWDLEVGAIGRRVYEMEGPCLLFEKIKDYPEGFRISNGTSGTWSRVALAMGLPKDTPVRTIYKEYEKALEKKIPPKEVEKDDAPCKENIMLGDEVDLYRFPTPMIHEGDGGRYIGAWDLVVCKDPDTGWENWGMYRFMIHTKDWLTGWPQTTSQLAMIFKERYAPKNQPMPIALVLGADPISHIMATAPLRPGENEAEHAGGIRGEPVELVKCETSDLLVPAHAEIVIEGELMPDKIAPDGPFGEYPGYRSGTMFEGVAVKVNCITYRNDPIVTTISLGTPPDDSSIAASLTAAVSMKRGLLRKGVPVTDVYVPPEGVTHLIIVGVKRGGADVARKVLDFFTTRRVMTNKHIVVDEDVDVFNMAEVLHAFATKCHPGRGILYEWYEGRSNSLTPFYSPEERKRLKGVSVVFDSTWPPSWAEDIIPIKASFKTIYSKEIQDKVIQNWEKYGIKLEG